MEEMLPALRLASLVTRFDRNLSIVIPAFSTNRTKKNKQIVKIYPQIHHVVRENENLRSRDILMFLSIRKEDKSSKKKTLKNQIIKINLYT